jgi:hypothetical protein
VYVDYYTSIFFEPAISRTGFCVAQPLSTAPFVRSATDVSSPFTHLLPMLCLQTYPLLQLLPLEPASRLSTPPRLCASWPGGGKQLVHVIACLELCALLCKHADLDCGHLQAEEVGLCQGSPTPPCAATVPEKECATGPCGSAPSIPGSLHGLFVTHRQPLCTHMPQQPVHKAYSWHACSTQHALCHVQQIIQW